MNTLLKGMLAVCLAGALSMAVAAPAGNEPPRSAPERVPSFGPNGTHWPSVVPTPFLYDESVPHIVEVECSWSAIGAALAAVTPGQAAAGVLIRVAPGNLAGRGAGAASAPVLKDLGSKEWARRVTVCPKNGYGTVTFSGGVKVVAVHGVCFAGFSGDSWKLQGCDRSALAWTRLTVRLAGYGAPGGVTRDVEFVEVVQAESALDVGDSSDFFANGKGGDIEGWHFIGCYTAPRYRPAKSSSHTDTMQFASGSGGGTYRNMRIQDGAYFASNNCAIQTGGVDGLVLEHTYVVAGGVSRSRYPWPEGADAGPEQAQQALNGSGRNFTAIDSVIMGSMRINTAKAPAPWVKVVNTRIKNAFGKAQTPVDGAWTVDASLSATNPPMPPMPTDSYLKSIWR